MVQQPTTPGARASLSHRAWTGLSIQALGDLLIELGPAWEAQLEGDRHARRGGPRQRAKKKVTFDLPFVDQVLAVLVTLAWLRHNIPHEALATLYVVNQSTISRAVTRIRVLLSRRGIKIPDRPDLDRPADQQQHTPAVGRLKTLHDVFAYAAAHQLTLRLDATEIQVRRPKAHRKGRKRFVSGKRRANTMKALIITDAWRRVLFCGDVVPGRMHDATQVKLAAIDDVLTRLLAVPARPGARSIGRPT